MGYTINILKDEEFEQLPYQHTAEAFAVTSPDKENIYVRHTNLHDFNKMLVEH